MIVIIIIKLDRYSIIFTIAINAAAASAYATIVLCLFQ